YGQGKDHPAGGCGSSGAGSAVRAHNKPRENPYSTASEQAEPFSRVRHAGGERAPLAVHEAIFINTRPLTIRQAAMMRIRCAGSPSTTRPTIKVPTAPMPVQMV